jgi:hypothetical protein
MKDNFDFYEKNQEDIVKGHLNEFVVINDASIVGYFKTEKEAFEAMKDYELGTFLVKKCLEKGTDIITYHTQRVRFA